MNWRSFIVGVLLSLSAGGAWGGTGEAPSRTAPATVFTGDKAAADNLTTGMESLLVIPVGWSDSAPPCTSAGARLTIQGNTTDPPATLPPDPRNVRDYYLKMSRGKITSFITAVAEPVVFAETRPTHCNLEQIALAVDDRVRSAHDADKYKRVMYLMSRPAGCRNTAGAAFLGDRRIYVFTCAMQVAAHELGHSFGLLHASAATSTGISEYGDPYDIMNDLPVPVREMNAPHRLVLGWIPLDRAPIVTASGTYSLETLENDAATTPQVRRIRRSTNPLSDDFIYVSYRVAVPNTLDSTISPRAATYVHRTSGPQSILFAVLQDGEVYEEPGIARIEQVSHTDAAGHVKITLGGSAPSPTTSQPPTTSGCTPSSTTLCLRNGRFRVTATWKEGTTTLQANAAPSTNDVGYFWFTQPGNTELGIRITDQTAVNGHFRVAYGGLTSSEYSIQVVDTATQKSGVYQKPGGSLCGGIDDTFGTADALRSGGAPLVTWGGPSVPPTRPLACTTDADTLCLQPGPDVIRTEVTWTDAASGARGFGQGGLLPNSALAGYFGLLGAANTDLLVKALNAGNGRYWIFTGGLTDSEYDVTFTNTRSARWVKVHNPAGTVCGATSDRLY